MAFAAIPALASAATLYSGGSVVPAGTKVTGTSEGGALFKGSGSEYYCSNAGFSGIVNKPGPSETKADVGGWTYGGTGVESTCIINMRYAKVSQGAPACLETGGVQSYWMLRGGSCNAASTALTLSIKYISEGVTCSYKRSNANPVRFNSNRESTPLTLTGEWSWAEAIENPPGCLWNLVERVTYRMDTAAGAAMEVR